VEQSCNVVISVLGHVAIVGRGIHTKFAKIRAVVFSFACTVAEQYAVSLALHVSVGAVVDALIRSVGNIVQCHAIHVDSLVHGVVLITSATIFVAKNATALDVTLPVLKSFLNVATNVLACVEKTVPLCVPSVTLKSYLLCYGIDLLTKRNPQDVCNFSTVVTS